MYHEHTKNEFINASQNCLKFILLTYFTFNGIIYKQTFSTSMSFPLSPIISDTEMEDLEESVKFFRISGFYFLFSLSILMILGFYYL